MTKNTKELPTYQELFVEFASQLTIFLISTTVIWAVLHLIFVFQVTWLQVMGAYLLAGIAKKYFTK